MALATVLYRPYRRSHHRFSVLTDDGVRIVGVHLPCGRRTLAIYCHGLLSSKNWWMVPGFVELLAERFDALAFDFRGHGESGGLCTVADREVLDLRAVVEESRAWGYDRVILVGASMGGATAIRYTALHGGVDGVVTIGAFADSAALGRPLTRYSLSFFRTPIGNTVVRWWRGTRMGELRPISQPIELVHRLAPRPLLIIHGEWDPLVELAHGQALYQRAREPKHLIVVPRGGHVTALLNRQTRDWIADWAETEIASCSIRLDSMTSDGRRKSGSS